ncbi:MAG: TetR family transcriptional regulator [Clostridiales bacterium]|nr:TetR family transcriptional regulator [Clostridiales bacterium]MDO4351391.1 TetR family transcriptional regulator [Eubacteriales bacterium]MDY4007740.1 TetR family transcriptional regulator [Candidatus Limiplasma sp.]
MPADATAAREALISAAIALINEYNGNTQAITSRLIARRANVGLGLINYHFGSKDGLILECVQRIIQGVIASFDVQKPYASDQERLTAWAQHVFAFLFANPAISRISILGDFAAYTEGCNTMRTQRSFLRALAADVPAQDGPLLVFVLTSAMQAAFLGASAAGPALGYNFSQPAQRDAFIQKTVALLFSGGGKEKR